MNSIENYTVNVLARLKATGSRDAIVSGTRRISGTEALRMVLRYVAVLRDTRLGNGDGVALFVENSPEALLLMLAVHFAGCRLVFVPPEPGNSELAAFVQRAQVKALFFDPGLEERARQITGRVDVPHVFGLSRSALATDFLAVAPDHTDLVPHEAADGRHAATLLYTGGTTGTPRLVTHRSRYYAALTRVSARYRDEVSTDPKMRRSGQRSFRKATTHSTCSFVPRFLDGTGSPISDLLLFQVNMFTRMRHLGAAATCQRRGSHPIGLRQPRSGVRRTPFGGTVSVTRLPGNSCDHCSAGEAS
ncbi:AMP-binding protein [Streptomyces sp. NBC_00663]|uniref:AMP-binding protein n=1 Tax=Streptomyces sp. NBC_00663 TaxID=2975801 RepID=UPI002E32FCDD|nr:AMP-binding protein [Streptomyces sp. NBC_00663]